MAEETWPDRESYRLQPEVELLTPQEWEKLAAGVADVAPIGNAELIRRVRGATVGPRVLRRLLDLEGALNVERERAAWYKRGTELARIEIERLTRNPDAAPLITERDATLAPDLADLGVSSTEAMTAAGDFASALRAAATRGGPLRFGKQGESTDAHA